MKKRSVMYIALGAAGVLVLLIIILIIARDKSHRTKEVNDGRKFIESLEAKDTAPVEEIIKKNMQEDLKAMRAERAKQLLSGETDIWPLFQDYVIMGDSRAVGFYFFGCLPEERVLAAGGDTIFEIGHHEEELEKLNPSFIYLCYGLNDVSIGYWPTPEEYVKEFLIELDILKQQAPNATIIISSILPARDPAFDLEPSWYNIPKYSDAVKQMCEDYGYYFCDNQNIVDEYPELWDPDGIHFREAFYPYWGANLLEVTYESME